MITGFIAAMTLAAHVWGAPACGQPTQAVEPYPDGAVSAQEGNEIVGWADPDACRVVLTPYGAINADPCTTIVHEWGHLTGHDHSSDPNSVMYESPGPYWRCMYGTNTDPLRTYRHGWDKALARKCKHGRHAPDAR